jgi:sugar lactone lactonase YvrE
MVRAIPTLCLLSATAAAQTVPEFHIDPTWPQPLPEAWLHGQLPGVCVDSHDHVVVLDRRNITADQTQRGSVPADHVLMFDQAGDLVASWGDPERVPSGRLHGCSFGPSDELWITGNRDGIIQKYSHDGELLLQIGTRGVVDTPNGQAVMAEDGTIDTVALNASERGFFYPSQVAVDPESGDVYVADGYGNKRVAVFDADGRYVRQWGRQATIAEVKAGAGGAFAYSVHCIVIGRDGLVYVCDREGDRVQVFDKQGGHVRNVWVATETTPEPDDDCPHAQIVLCFVNSGTVWGLALSPDPAQRWLYVADGRNEQIHIFDRASGERLGGFGRAGHGLGQFDYAHSMAIDSAGNLYVAETGDGKRVQRFLLDAR